MNKKLEKKQYDFSSLNEFFNGTETPNQLADSLALLMFNYAESVDEEHLGSFKDDVGTLYCLYEQMIELAIKAGETNVLRKHLL